MERPKVLLVGESLNQYSHLAGLLTKWGGECRFATSHEEACTLLGQQTFELVVSEMHPMHGSALRLIPLLEGSPTSLFCFHAIEDGCLWMPVVERGQSCWGAPALRPSAFARVLRRTLAEGRTVSVSERRMPESPAAPPPSPPQSSATPRADATSGSLRNPT